MTQAAFCWMPPQDVRVKAMGVTLRGAARQDMFLQEVYGSDRKIKGYRPPGGSVDFGEASEKTLLREFKEELNADITIEGFLGAVENIYVHEGQQGHEIIFLYQVILPPHLMEGDWHPYTEERGDDPSGFAWVNFKHLAQEGRLFPQQLMEVVA